MSNCKVNEKVIQSASGHKLDEIFNFEEQLLEAYESDFEKMLLKFEISNFDTFAAFSKIWKETNLNLIFGGEKTLSEIGKFTDICLYVALKLFLHSFRLSLKIGSFYLLYALYVRQPFKNYCKIRLIPHVYKKLHDFIQTMKYKKKYDLLYIYGILQIDNAFQYVATITPMSLNIIFMNKINIPSEICFKKHLINLTEDKMNKFQTILEKYKKQKQKISTRLPEMPLSFFESNIIQELETVLNSIRNESLDQVELDEPEVKTKTKRIMRKKKCKKKSQKF